MATAAAKTGSGGSSGTARRTTDPARDHKESDFWFERSQAYAAAGEFARRVLDGIDDDGSSGSALREAAMRLVAVVASAVSTSRDQLVAKLQEAYDRVNAVAGLLVLHCDQVQMSSDKRAAYRENLSAVAGLLFGLRRSITQER